MNNKEYAVYDSEGKYITQGDAHKISEELGIRTHYVYETLYHQLNGHYRQHRYRFVPVEPRFKIIGKDGKILFDGDRDECLDYLCIEYGSFYTKLYTQRKTKNNQYTIEKYFPRKGKEKNVC